MLNIASQIDVSICFPKGFIVVMWKYSDLDGELYAKIKFFIIQIFSKAWTLFQNKVPYYPDLFKSMNRQNEKDDARHSRHPNLQVATWFPKTNRVHITNS